MQLKREWIVGLGEDNILLGPKTPNYSTYIKSYL